uniref:Uncharacterized protein n=1 Tax=Parascaris univalens TaxID=6257 RepID=A0A915BKV8_PARUN
MVAASGGALRFSAVKGHPDIARSVLRLRNASDKKLNYKFKCEKGCSVAAHPRSRGVIAPHSTYHCVLTWHRTQEANSWSGLRPPRLAIVADFSTGGNFSDGEQNITKFIANITEDEQDVHEMPPKTSISFATDRQPIVTSCEMSSNDKLSSKAQVETSILNQDMVYYDRFIEWIQRQPMKFLLVAVIVFMVVTCALSAESDDHDD